MPILLHPTLDRLRQSLAAELADMRIAAHRIETAIARAERIYEHLTDLVDQLSGPHGNLEAVPS